MANQWHNGEWTNLPAGWMPVQQVYPAVCYTLWAVAAGLWAAVQLRRRQGVPVLGVVLGFVPVLRFVSCLADQSRYSLWGSATYEATMVVVSTSLVDALADGAHFLVILAISKGWGVVRSRLVGSEKRLVSGLVIFIGVATLYDGATRGGGVLAVGVMQLAAVMYARASLSHTLRVHSIQVLRLVSRNSAALEAWAPGERVESGIAAAGTPALARNPRAVAGTGPRVGGRAQGAAAAVGGICGGAAAGAGFGYAFCRQLCGSAALRVHRLAGHPGRALDCLYGRVCVPAGQRHGYARHWPACTASRQHQEIHSAAAARLQRHGSTPDAAARQTEAVPQLRVIHDIGDWCPAVGADMGRHPAAHIRLPMSSARIYLMLPRDPLRSGRRAAKERPGERWGRRRGLCQQTGLSFGSRVFLAL
ncbi:hypothetical protein DL89DRAFT_281644 [Linderina pennispora]|uniref:Uncharacterized protein n=1 Tax=Linderina pennispora TaxID=61395 RepID=A0A1Y1WHJ0_9FUNG|nr:uncharacterized protein DL89DRAFT_281644 [Linderina pennispora]ORX72967.1 hypothetical protein DL89DRAFT_281644 [Linderina pennispora]